MTDWTFTALWVLCFLAVLNYYPQLVPNDRRSCLAWIGVLTFLPTLIAISLWTFVAWLLGMGS